MDVMTRRSTRCGRGVAAWRLASTLTLLLTLLLSACGPAPQGDTGESGGAGASPRDASSSAATGGADGEPTAPTGAVGSATTAVADAASGDRTATTGVEPTATISAEATGVSGPGAAARGAGPRVVATFSVLGDLVRNVGGNRIELSTLVGPGGDAHTFEPSPGDVRTIERATLIFENGLEFEGWLPELVEASGQDATRVAVTDGMRGLIEADEDQAEEHAEDEDQAEETPGAEEEHGEGEEHADETPGAEDDHAGEEETPGAEAEEHEHGEYDPHVWHDVARVKSIVERVRDALIEADPAGAAGYRENARRYLSELDELDGYVRTQVAELPSARRKLVTSHDTFGYYAERYGFEVVGTALASATTEASDPSPRDLQRLVDEIRRVRVPAIFAENVSNPELIERIAAESGVEVGPPLFTDALGEPGSAGATYLEMMRYNTDSIVRALGR